MLAQLSSIQLRLYCILQLGYFKAQHLFFAFRVWGVIEDATYVQNVHFADTPLADFELSKEARLKLQRLILDLYQYRYCDATERQKLAAKAGHVAMVYSKPIYLYRELMQYLADQRIIAPGYSFMQDTIGKALLAEQARLIAIAGQHLKAEDTAALDRLLAGCRKSLGFAIKRNR